MTVLPERARFCHSAPLRGNSLLSVDKDVITSGCLTQNERQNDESANGIPLRWTATRKHRGEKQKPRRIKMEFSLTLCLVYLSCLHLCIPTGSLHDKSSNMPPSTCTLNYRTSFQVSNVIGLYLARDKWCLGCLGVSTCSLELLIPINGSSFETFAQQNHFKLHPKHTHRYEWLFLRKWTCLMACKWW